MAMATRNPIPAIHEALERVDALPLQAAARCLNGMSLLIAALAISACGRAPSAPVAAAPAPTSAVDQPANPDFIGRIWVANTPGSPRGSMLVFLPDRSLLMDSCFETYRISKWGVAGERIRWLEDTIPIEAEVKMPSSNELTLQIAGQDRVQTFVAAQVPFVCPDMPR